MLCRGILAWTMTHRYPVDIASVLAEFTAAFPTGTNVCLPFSGQCENKNKKCPKYCGTASYLLV